jgi:hypothetical protein
MHDPRDGVGAAGTEQNEADETEPIDPSIEMSFHGNATASELPNAMLAASHTTLLVSEI